MDSVFDRLVKTLTSAERMEMLEKVQQTHLPASDALYEDEFQTEAVDFAKEYQKFGFWSKLLILLKMLLFRKDRDSLVEEHLFAGLVRSIETQAPGLIDGRELGPVFHGNLEALKISLAPMSEAIQRFLLNRSDFYAFLGTLEMPSFYGEYLQKCEPAQLSRSHVSEDDVLLRNECMGVLDRLFDAISDSDRQVMYFHAKNLSALRELVLYPFERILSKFNKQKHCRFADAKEALAELTNILYSLRYTPRGHLLEALYLYQVQGNLDDEDFKLEESLSLFIEKANAALLKIREFNTHIPMVRLTRLVSGNLLYRPVSVSSGEDWFSHFRSYYERTALKNLDSWLVSRHVDHTRVEAARFVNLERIEPLHHYHGRDWGEGLSVCHEASVGFLSAFLERDFLVQMNPYLKRVLIDGEFYREQNGHEYADFYHRAIALREQIAAVDRFLDETGEGGQLVAKVQAESAPVAIKTRKIAGALKRADILARKLLQEARDSLNSLNQILYGILHGEKGGRYDTLSNLGYIGGRDNAVFLRRLDEIHLRIGTFTDLLSEMQEQEEEVFPG